MRLRHITALVRFKETLFGLPLLLAGALLLLAEGTLSLSFRHLWIFPAFASARLTGMAFNRVIDRHIDAQNPRTAHRLIPSGVLSAASVSLVAWGALALFLLSCSFLGGVCAFLSPFIAALLLFYSYMKRIHASCHFVLGLIHFFSPVMAAAALSNTLTLPPCLLGLAALFSIAASDILYAFQDIDFDRAAGVHSLPAKLGTKASLLVVYILRAFCILAVIALGISAHLGPLFYGAPVALGMLFFVFPKPFYSSNVLVSLSLLLFTIGGLLWRVTS